jgi:hypothetical protein
MSRFVVTTQQEDDLASAVPKKARSKISSGAPPMSAAGKPLTLWEISAAVYRILNS